MTRTIDGFDLFASMAVPVPLFAVAGILSRGIIGAGVLRVAEKNQGKFPEAA